MKQWFKVELETERQLGEEELVSVIEKGFSAEDKIKNVKVEEQGVTSPVKVQVNRPRKIAEVAHTHGPRGAKPAVPGRGPGGNKLR